MPALNMKYGWSLKIDKYGISIMLNGRMLSFQKGFKEGTWERGNWRFVTWENVWRKNKEPVGDGLGIAPRKIDDARA